MPTANNSTLTKARTWVLLILGVLSILCILAGWASVRTNDKLKAVDLRIGAAEACANEAKADARKLKDDLPAIQERLGRIETSQEHLARTQERILAAVESIRDR